MVSKDYSKEFDDMLKKALEKRDQKIKSILENDARRQKLLQRKSMNDLKKHINKFISIPIFIGIFASLLTLYIYGWEFLQETLLSWTIGATIVTTALALMEKYNLNR